LEKKRKGKKTCKTQKKKGKKQKQMWGKLKKKKKNVGKVIIFSPPHTF